jgi:hypothetical protein
VKKKGEVVVLKLDSAERGVIVAATNELRNERIEKGKSIEFVNEVFLKLSGK